MESATFENEVGDKLLPLYKKKFAVMGIVNVTDDSFYDGGKYNSRESAIHHAMRLIEEGADIIDIGASSSRPGATLHSPQEEIERAVPIVAEVAKRAGDKVIISVDTTWSRVAQAALDSGAQIINDISAGRFDSEMASVIAKTGCAVVLMHSRKTPQDMQENPQYENVADDVCAELLSAVKIFKDAGVSEEKIILDPGFGFAKSVKQNVELLHTIHKVTSLGYPVIAGLSRKSFIGALTGQPVEKRLAGTLGATARAYVGGVKMFRVHDVSETVDFLKVL